MYTDRQMDKRVIRILAGVEQNDEDMGFRDGVWGALTTSQLCGCGKLSAPLVPPWEAGGLVLRKSHETNLWLIIYAQRTSA